MSCAPSLATVTAARGVRPCRYNITSIAYPKILTMLVLNCREDNRGRISSDILGACSRKIRKDQTTDQKLSP